MNRKEILKDCLYKAAVSHRKPLGEAQLEDLTTVSMETLSLVPTESLEEVFEWDLKNRTGMRGMPSDRDLIAAYRAWKESNRTTQEWRQSNIPSSACYTVNNLPWCYHSDRLRYLVDKRQLSVWTDEEAEEYRRNYKDMTWQHGDLRINETLKNAQDIADGMPLAEVVAQTRAAYRKLRPTKTF